MKRRKRTYREAEREVKKRHGIRQNEGLIFEKSVAGKAGV